MELTDTLFQKTFINLMSSSDLTEKEKELEISLVSSLSIKNNKINIHFTSNQVKLLLNESKEACDYLNEIAHQYRTTHNMAKLK